MVGGPPRRRGGVVSDLGAAIRDHRIALGWDQLRLALAASVALRDIDLLESGADVFVSVLFRAVGPLGLSVDCVTPDGTIASLSPRTRIPFVETEVAQVHDVDLAGALTSLAECEVARRAAGRARCHISVPSRYADLVAELVWGKWLEPQDRWVDQKPWQGVAVSVATTPRDHASLVRDVESPRWPDPPAVELIVPCDLDVDQVGVYRSLITAGERRGVAEEMARLIVS